MPCPGCGRPNTVGSAWAGEGGWQTVFSCHGCGFSKNVPAGLYGQSTPCPRCGVVIFADRVPVALQQMLGKTPAAVGPAPRKRFGAIFMLTGVIALLFILFLGLRHRNELIAWVESSLPERVTAGRASNSAPAEVATVVRETPASQPGTSTPAPERALSGANFSGQDLGGRDFSRADLRNADFRAADLSQADFFKADLTGTLLDRARLNGANLNGASLRQVDLQGADLTGAQLVAADLTGATLVDAVLNSADLSRASLEGADLSRADLTDANMNRTMLSRVRAPAVSLVGAFIGKAQLVEASLPRADFSDAYLIDSDLSRADLTEARFDGTQLIRCRLTGARLKGADLSRAVLLETSVSEENFGEQLVPPRLEQRQEPGAAEPAAVVPPVVSGPPAAVPSGPAEENRTMPEESWRLRIEAGGILGPEVVADQDFEGRLSAMAGEEYQRLRQTMFVRATEQAGGTGEIRAGVLYVVEAGTDSGEQVTLEIRWLNHEKRVIRVKVKKIVPGRPQLEIMAVPAGPRPGGEPWIVQFLFRGRSIAEYRIPVQGS